MAQCNNDLNTLSYKKKTLTLTPLKRTHLKNSSPPDSEDAKEDADFGGGVGELGVGHGHDAHASQG